ncbi:hypothetical protein, partial [Sharpea azabuensis]|uniref:hypothetical protein n=1 Tax=Sharpea azabuensis TaxID=322505 RepID=UPI002E806FE6
MSAGWIAFCIIMSYILLLCFIVYIGINLKTNKVMKELTIEEKAKRYDEAYKVAKNIHIFSSDLAGIKRMEEIFPELKEESDDERIRKALINGFNKLDKSAVWYNGITNGQILAWHEKQNEQKHTDNVEPKFKVGDWVVYTGYLLKDSGKEIYVMQVASVEDDRYNFTDTSTLCFDSEKDMRSWTIQDAKAGDVLVASDKSLFIYDGSINENGSVGFHIAFAKDTDIILNSDDGCGWEEKDSCHPATKEQRDQLEKAMADAGYTFDFEKKELKKIEQKPAWGEEDETKIKSIIALLKSPALCTMDGNKGIIDESIKYLKSLKYRVQP